MADFKQAVEWKLEGKDVFHQGRNMILNDGCLSMSDINGHMGKSLDTEDFYYDAWEIYEKKINDIPISLSDKIKELRDYYDRQCEDQGFSTLILKPDEVKEAVKKLKEDLCKELFERHGVNESSFDRIPQRTILDSIKKHFGPKLA